MVVNFRAARYNSMRVQASWRIEENVKIEVIEGWNIIKKLGSIILKFY